MPSAHINPTIIRWGLTRAKQTPEWLADRGKWKQEKVDSWLKGDAHPTFKQAQDAAKHLKIPFGFLFLEKPPKDNFKMPDFRTLADKPKPLSLELIDTIRAARRRQNWLSDHRRETGVAPSTMIKLVNKKMSPAKAANVIAKALNIKALRNTNENLSAWTKSIEAMGICVLRQSVVGNNTRRKLQVDEFRGFALADEYAPFIVINSADHKAAQVFTLAHELAHICLGETGISNVELKQPSAELNDDERFCNKVAAELLVPQDEFLAAWTDNDSLVANTMSLARLFSVSYSMIARRAYELGLIQKKEFFSFIKERQRLAEEKRTKERSGDGGPTFYNMVRIKNGRAFTKSVLVALRNNQVLVRDGAKLLGVKPVHLSTLMAS